MRNPSWLFLRVYCALSLTLVEIVAQDSFEFRLPQRESFRLEADELRAASSTPPQEWLRARSANDADDVVELSSRVVIQVASNTPLASLIDGHPLRLARTVRSNLFILQAPDARTAAREAARLAGKPGVTASYPVMRRMAQLEGLYGAAPNDPHFPPQLGNTIGQWYLENRNVTNGASLGPDLNVRAAWPYTRGESVTLAVADLGIEMAHRDLTNQLAGAPHRNFNNGSTNAGPLGTSAAHAHGTECAGLAAATGNNGFGMSGVAPAAQLASWVVFSNATRLVTDEQLMDMYPFASNIVDVQSHSWNRGGLRQTGPSLLELAGIEDAIDFGRDGKGVVMVRAAGNDRARGANANDDYPSDPRAIAVGSVLRNGLLASFSEPGACVLLAAPSADPGTSGLFTTDLLGVNGANFISFLPPFEYLSDFAFNTLGFNGTSASTPLVAGVAALVLSANPELTYRDVQQILLLSARHFDLADPDNTINGAGLLVNHNVGFGVPDAGHAVRLARTWPSRLPLQIITLTVTNPFAIPDDGLRLLVSGPGVPVELMSIRTAPGTGLFPDTPTVLAPLVEVSPATNVPPVDLSGKGALIERNTNNSFADKIFNAAAAGAEFAVIYNFVTNTVRNSCPGGDQLCPMGATDFVPIPAVFISHTNGVALRELFATNTEARAQIRLQATNHVFDVTNMLLLEHAGVRVQSDHPLRGDVRITLVSPAGTRSVLQRFNADTNAGPVDWTYWSTHHFYESSVGQWRLEVSDQLQGGVGSVLLASLILRGTTILDSDADGLDDTWEQTHLGSLARGPKDDPEGDGYNNAREQVMGTNPMAANEPFRIDLARWNSQLARLSWPGVASRSYEVWGGEDPAALSLITNLHGRFPETEWFASSTNGTARFFQIRTAAP